MSAAPPTEPDVAFIFGALRSGTTVFRLMLNAHPRLVNPGEYDFLFDYLHPDPGHPTGWRYDLDGLRLDRIFRARGLVVPDGAGGAAPDGVDLLRDFLRQIREAAGVTPGQQLSLNLHRHVDRVAGVLPGARIIHMMRDPRDVARSSIQMGWAGNPYFGVDHWIGTERGWDAAAPALAGSQVMTLTYEDLFRDTEGWQRRVCDFLGVPWAEEMRRYYEGTTYAAPDPGLVEQWKRKADPDDLALLEGKAGPLMQARGYALSQTPRVPGAAERARLRLQDRLHRWKFGMKRHGALLFWGEKLTRALGLKEMHRRLRLRMNRNQQAYLK